MEIILGIVALLVFKTLVLNIIGLIAGGLGVTKSDTDSAKEIADFLKSK